MSDFKRLYDQLDRIETRLDTIDVKLAEYNAELTYHVYRTNLLEDKIEPLVQHREQVRGATKLIGWIVAIAGTVAGIKWWK